ncbi:uncharacterized protein KD926_003171 [Aspergillus affinis]|uniref:uncharacterized protein n=1 Tax=Aspergillus affinis TaxID=1070780 RepID=UPI0022FDE8BB|nr:uncharacterized protein KD926_003171 [Aspergillus affinis]KAI9035631.1 hypothetical protein KD926_003171 [Aspergillus affinis]
MHVHSATVFAGLLAAATAVSGSSAHNNSAIYKALYAAHSSSTPVFQNVSGQSVNPLVRVLQGLTKDVRSLVKRDELPVGICAPGTPCVNGACCSKKGICGFSPDECGKDTCISDCDAKAECGQSSTRKCDKRQPSDIDIVSLTHLNFAFAFFHPTTFQILPMSANDETLYPQLTGLKSKKPSLKTWIAVGGWSFNDATNSPNTQTAFGDMASSAANRQTFIKSLVHFMQTWGFDGVDLDWEYPGADDRGGNPDDTANFVELLRDMKNAFQGRYGISVTLPASYWYLRWFDLQGMQEHLDFFNIMTYDIHGVWDASNKNTGPYVRPHTNITEIKLGLDLLWRNDVDPSRVNFGLGWYGRSFTLEDPSCNQPNCIFSYGGKPGECTNSSGTLSNSEIRRIITENNLTPTLNAEAAVKWISWDSNQWVSYDDGETIQMKIAEANKLCLGGVLIWAVDLDDLDHSSSNDMLGIGPSNGVSPADTETFRKQKGSIERAATIANSCYWTFCGGQCVERYTSHAYAKGQVPNIDGDESCRDGTVRTLCCAPGTTTGTCSWNGWNGVGMACSTEYCPSGTELIAMNTNSYEEDTDLRINNNLTCTGGAQSYCCSGFVPSQLANTDSLSLLGDYRPVDEDQKELSMRSEPSKLGDVCQTSVLASVATFLGAFGVLGESLMTGLAMVACFTKVFHRIHHGDESHGSQGNVEGSKPHSLQDDIVNRLGQGPAGIGQKPTDRNQNKPSNPKGKFGRYQQVVYKKGTKDCQVTYTCEYGLGFDETCDNMRWAIEVGFDGDKVYHKAQSRFAQTYAERWYKTRDPAYRDLAARPPGWPKGRGDQPRCNVEEFPFGSLQEAGNNNYQILRFVSRDVNSAHSEDWNAWLNAVWWPCQRLRKQRKIEPNGPPITMTWSPFKEGDNRIKANNEAPHNKAPHFIEAYGFNSQGATECFPTYTYPVEHGTAVTATTKTLTDYGFRVHPEDPMFLIPYQYPYNEYMRTPPTADRPHDFDQVNWLRIKRDVTLGVLNQDLPLSAIQEAEEAETVSKVAEAFLKHRSGAEEPAATNAAEFSIPVETDTVAGSSWQPWSEQHVPVETGVPEPEEEKDSDSRMMRRRRQHLQEHQRGHAGGHGHLT